MVIHSANSSRSNSRRPGARSAAAHRRRLLRLTATVGVMGSAAALLVGSIAAGTAVSAGAATPTTPAPATTPATPSTLTVSSLNDSGPGTLRAAIQTANAGDAGTSFVIDFSVTGTITLASALPNITADVTIDGTSAPGYTSGGAPVVEVDCNGQGGLDFATGSDGSQLLGLAVDDASGNGVTLDAGSITVNNDYIGLDMAGGPLGNGGDGISVSASSSSDHIGLNPTNASGVVGNVISANTGNGIGFYGATGNTVVANRIGTDPTGTTADGNGGDGISLGDGASDNTIGGTVFTDSATGQTNNPTGTKGQTTPVFVVPPLGNLVSGNRRNGIIITNGAQGNILNGNFVGTTANGDGALGNGDDGVLISGANDNSLIGCQVVNNPFVYYNVLDANGQNGLQISNSNDITVQANFFGVGADNTALLGNQQDGILVDGSSSNVQVGGVIPLGNVAAGNGTNGIEVSGSVSGFTTFNTFGGLLAFKGAAPNGNDGLLITATGGNNLVRTNVFSGNDNNGIELGGTASGVTIDPNIAGLTTNGGTALPNGNDGLLIGGYAHNNTIGGSLRSVIPQDTFSGNQGYGVVMSGHAHNNRLFSSYVGTAIFGKSAIPNHLGGVLVTGAATRNTIGRDADVAPSNLISGNTGNGVTLAAGTSRTRVVNNFIGLNRLRQPLRNSGPALVDRGANDAILGNALFPGSGTMVMNPPQRLTPGQQLSAGPFTLIMQLDGNLVEYKAEQHGLRQAVWSTNTEGHPGAYATMQGDGNFVVYGPAGRALWASNTDGHPGSLIVLGPKGRLVVMTRAHHGIVVNNP